MPNETRSKGRTIFVCVMLSLIFLLTFIHTTIPYTYESEERTFQIYDKTVYPTAVKIC